MNGVCREFYNATRGRGIYKLIKALTDSDIVVDIVSGTSAGGINGVLLSYAVANSYEKIVVDFKEFGDIWRESGDINKLLRPLKKEKRKPKRSRGFAHARRNANANASALSRVAWPKSFALVLPIALVGSVTSVEEDIVNGSWCDRV
jgi:hypothetical protein